MGEEHEGPGVLLAASRDLDRCTLAPHAAFPLQQGWEAESMGNL